VAIFFLFQGLGENTCLLQPALKSRATGLYNTYKGEGSWRPKSKKGELEIKNVNHH